MVKTIIKTLDPTVRVVEVRASKGKFARAEPVAALYEENRIRHAADLPDLETELCEYVPLNSKKSPDRLDGLVWAFTYLMLKPKTNYFMG